MKLHEIAIWWSSTEEMKPEHHGKPQFVVLEHMAEGNRKYSYLYNSVGRCFMGWERAKPAELAAYVMFIYNQATARDGVPVAEAHAELMKIDEYREWQTREEGPFKDAYLQWVENAAEKVLPDSEASLMTTKTSGRGGALVRLLGI
jgi:hypothetical protein